MKTVIPTIIIGLAVVLAAVVLGKEYNYKFTQEKTIYVNGGAEVSFNSDLIVWKGSYSRNSTTLETAYSELKQDENKVREFLSKEGINSDSVVFSAIDISKNYDTKYDQNGIRTSNIFTGYTLSQDIKVQSSNVELVEKVSREVTGLIQSGVEFNSYPPSYYYTKLSDLKINLLSKASEDGLTRAKTIAQESDNKIGKLKRADMGVFQIVGQYSDENYSWGGTLNTADKVKTASITVKMEFVVK